MDEMVRAVLDTYHDRLRKEAIEFKLGTPESRRQSRDRRLLAVGPETAQFLNLLVRSLKTPRILELGTSYGYSTIWLADAARAACGHVTTIELQDYKSIYAREMATKAGLIDWIDFKIGDALVILPELRSGFDFVLVDIWKDLYTPCLEAFYPMLNPGAIIVADNMISTGSEDIARYTAAVRSKPNIASILLPVGKGLEISTYSG